MTSRFGYAYIPRIDPSDKSIEAAAFNAMREDERELRDEIQMKAKGKAKDIDDRNHFNQNNRDGKLGVGALSSLEHEIDEEEPHDGPDLVTGPIEIRSPEEIADLSKEETSHFISVLQNDKIRLTNLITQNQNTNPDEKVAQLIKAQTELVEYKQKLQRTRMHNRQISARLKTLQKEYDALHEQKRELGQGEFHHARGAGGSANIDGELIMLLALRLAELPSFPWLGDENEDENGHGNEVKEIAAALLDEVDRANDPLNNEEVYFDVGFEVNLARRRVEWGEEREKRLFNLEGIIQILLNRVENLEKEKVRRSSEWRNAQEDETMFNDMSELTVFENEDVDDDDQGLEVSSKGQSSESNIANTSRNDLAARLNDVEGQFQDLTDRLGKVEGGT
ncbi:uncharacterized protein I303_101299 [Kwoniella dejecticola CBS 10117]|uniref:Uncharacterized protein n=1 Tax=Kwoniella dejecticola CBS 10117 TaxID=1296121 RepID=A0A1A6AHC8_9TREE|nr:uncharacterized protein I303_01307 [Kwoniella dejecticola CBS 10117]OBR89480.1 hypothetical protein I303_01307 [Kwoniella dejecticola CBS 10117]